MCRNDPLNIDNILLSHETRKITVYTTPVYKLPNVIVQCPDRT